MRFQFPALRKSYAALAVGGLLSATSALAGPTYLFTTSEGTQPSTVGIISLTQVDSTTVNILVDLFDTATPDPRYGFINSGGPHTPFAFTIAGTETGLSATFLQPAGGAYTFGIFSLDLGGGGATPYGTYGVAIDSTAGNGTSKAYFGDLEFNLVRTSGLSTDDFITNAALDVGSSGPAYFAADLTNGGAGNTGSQAWKIRVPVVTVDPQCIDCSVPEPGSLALLAIGGLALTGLRRNRLRSSMT